MPKALPPAFNAEKVAMWFRLLAAVFCRLKGDTSRPAHLPPTMYLGYRGPVRRFSQATPALLSQENISSLGVVDDPQFHLAILGVSDRDGKNGSHGHNLLSHRSGSIYQQ